MPTLTPIPESPALEIIPIHFDVPGHYFLLNEFIDSANNTKEILDSLNKEFLDSKLNYRIVVCPPESGTFKLKIALDILGRVTLAFCLFCESDIGKGYIKGLTGHLPSYWAEEAGKFTRKLAIEDKEDEKQELEKKTTAMIMAECTKGFLQKNITELNKIGLQTNQFRNAYAARNKFYETCINNPDINGVGFDDNHDFPFKRKDFPNFVVNLPPEEEEDEEWFVEIKDIKVISPNWERKGRQWQAKCDENKSVFFQIEDEIFWEYVEREQIPTKVCDFLKVQWAYTGSIKNRKNIRVLKVLEYNGSKISDFLSEGELDELLRNHSTVTSSQIKLL